MKPEAQARNQLYDALNDRIRNKISSQISGQLKMRLEGQLYWCIGYRLYFQFRTQLQKKLYLELKDLNGVEDVG